MQQFSTPNAGETQENQALKDKPVYVGVIPHSNRVAIHAEKGKSTKRGESEGNATPDTVNKFTRSVEDGLLLVVAAQIYGKEVCALICSGATRCFVTPACMKTVGLKGTPRDIFLELGNGEKYLSRGYVPDVPVVTAG